METAGAFHLGKKPEISVGAEVEFPIGKKLLHLVVNPCPGGVLPYMGYAGMCRCEGYGFQAVYSRIGYINQSVWV